MKTDTTKRIGKTVTVRQAIAPTIERLFRQMNERRAGRAETLPAEVRTAEVHREAARVIPPARGAFIAPRKKV
jgi:hypothetical protein